MTCLLVTLIHTCGPIKGGRVVSLRACFHPLHYALSWDFTRLTESRSLLISDGCSLHGGMDTPLCDDAWSLAARSLRCFAACSACASRTSFITAGKS